MVENKTSLPGTSCPRQLFGIDLKAGSEEKVDLRHHIIAMGDFNSEYIELLPYILALQGNTISQLYGYY